MTNVRTFADAAFAMKSRETVTLKNVNGDIYKGVINAVQAEDGSGKCWFITIECEKGARTVFLREE